MTEQVSNPLAVLHVGLATRHLLDIARIDQQELKPVLQQN
jgi:hypothetical protein